MIKLGEKRINPGHIIQYYPNRVMDNATIIFELSSKENETVMFDSEEERDGMLDMIDKYLVSFDNGTITVPDLGSMPTFILGGQGPEEGPGGVSIQ
jgi:hypothetical protein